MQHPMRLPMLPERKGWYWGHLREPNIFGDYWVCFRFDPEARTTYTTPGNPPLELSERELCLVKYDCIGPCIEPPVIDFGGN